MSHVAANGEWVYPVRHGFLLECCDCALVHRIDFRLVAHGTGKRIEFRAFRDERATKRARQRKGASWAKIATGLW